MFSNQLCYQKITIAYLKLVTAPLLSATEAEQLPNPHPPEARSESG